MLFYCHHQSINWDYNRLKLREDKSVPIFKCLYGHLSLYCNRALYNIPCWTCSLTYVCAFSVTLKWLGDTSVSTEADRFMWNKYGTKHINNSRNRKRRRVVYSPICISEGQTLRIFLFIRPLFCAFPAGMSFLSAVLKTTSWKGEFQMHLLLVCFFTE